jgi:ferredoxin-type protein NapH
VTGRSTGLVDRERIAAHRFLIARRTLQIGVLALLWLGASRRLGWLVGDLSASTLFGVVPLADPFAVLQILATGASLSSTVLVGAAIVLAFYTIAAVATSARECVR